MIKNLLYRIIVKGYSLIRSIYYSSQYNNYRRMYDIHSSFKFNGDEIKFYGKGKIIIGSNSYIGSYSILQSVEDCQVKIGSCCSISHNVRVYTESNEADQSFINNYNKRKKRGNVLIGDGVWIGVNVCINPGIEIGMNSVIGANSVVTKNVLPNSIYGGVPAKFIKAKS